MSWREELLKLDEELAAGQISADDYRMRRDQVLSSAVSSPGQDRQQPGTGPQPALGQPAAGAGTPGPPVPPAGPTPQPAAPHAGEADKTQRVSASGTGAGAADSDRTQIVPGAGGDVERTQAVGWHTARPRGDDAERTQVVPGVPPQAVAGGHVPRPAPGTEGLPPGWGDPQADPGPPWSGSDFPPLAATGTPDWIRQGPEVFEDSGRGNGGKIAAIVLAVIVLGGLVFGAFWLWGRGDNTAGPGGSTTSASASPTKTSRTSKPPAPDPLPVAVLPGKEERHTDVKAFTDVPKLNYLNEAELQAYDTANAAEAKFNVRHLDSGSRAVFLLVKAAGADTARGAAEALRDIQLQNGATAATAGPTGVFVTEIEAKDGQPAQIRGHYVNGNTVVRVEVWNSTGLAAAQADFPTVIDAQLKVLSADA